MNAVMPEIPADGRFAPPATMRPESKLEQAETAMTGLADGSIVAEAINPAIRRAQAMVRRYVPAGAALVDELIAERRTDSGPA